MSAIRAACESYLSGGVSGSAFVWQIDDILLEPFAPEMPEATCELINEFQLTIAFYQEDEKIRNRSIDCFGDAKLMTAVQEFYQRLRAMA